MAACTARLGVASLAAASVMAVSASGATDLRVVRDGRVLMEIDWRVVPCRGDRSPGEHTRQDTQFSQWLTGQPLGTLKLFSQWRDGRGQRIDVGEYRLFYAVQPRSKNHVGTTLYRDFLVLVTAESSRADDCLPERVVLELSRQVSGTSHPAVLEIRRAPVVPGSLTDGTTLETEIEGEPVLLVLTPSSATSGPF